MGVRSDVLLAPTAPIAETRLGTVTIRWNGLQQGGSVPPNFLDYVEVHVASGSNFTPSTSTLAGKIDKTGGDFFVITDLPYNAVRFVRLVFVDQDGKRGAPSTQVQITVKPLVDTDIIGKILSGANIVPGSITASESIIGNSITGNLIQALTIKSGSLEANIITADKINAGAITAVAISAGAITAAKISAGAITADKISAGAITADKISAGAVTADTIAANSITATNGKIQSLDAGIITAGTLTGRTVQTSSSGKRVRMSASSNAFEILNSVGTVTGRVQTYNTNNNQIVVEAADGVSGFTAAGNSVSMATNIGFINLSTDGNGLVVGRALVKIQSIGNGSGGSSTYNIVHSRNGPSSGFPDGTLNRIQLSGTGIRNVNVGGSGLLTISTSDERVKQNIEPLTLGLSIVEKLSPKKFEFKDEPGIIEYGLIAQEVREVLNTLGITDNTNFVFEDESEENIAKLPEGETGPVLGVEYMKLIPILINSVKELQDRVKTLEKERDNT